MAKYLMVVNFEAVQNADIFNKSHGKPPWIKLYVKLLDNEDFDELSYETQLVYLKLLLLAARKENCIPNDENFISKRIGVDAETTRKSIDELLESGWIKGSRGKTQLRTIRESLANDSPLEEKRIEEEEKRTYSQLAVVWGEQPGLIRHRPAYFNQPKAITAMRASLRTYDPESVCEAIRWYSRVLASPDHFFSHSWTFVDFLKRGLDRFVAEADPWTAMRSHPTNGQIQKGASVESIMARATPIFKEIEAA